ncbi:L,D-transpeptidase family protein [Amphritea sp. 1_MG-2023]|uniref:L,D-transpeptidase family protein n=1 Tax=Amphritea sp. 1_MG-2023 TaxID=3062670 RepID=UPI0026E30049|nr:L,D-transpeptidase family protein [Amphritea sp. 1_MG-2023]MDO6564424.1 L,D-transpeptidase family protein [Amphritea sp. 1_MG-2023]
MKSLPVIYLLKPLRKAVLVSLCGLLPLSVQADTENFSLDQESLLLASLGDLQQNQMTGAMDKLRALIKEQPDFRLAQLIYADLMAAQGGALSTVGNNGRSDKKTLQGLISEARARMSVDRYKPQPDTIPGSLLQMSPKQKHVIVIDTNLSRLYLFENHNGLPKLIKDYYVSYGRGGVDKRKRGDLKTPLGVYFTTGRLTDEQLPPRYGSGALPINYPNAWDQRLGNTGSGIWVHGSPKDTFSRPPQASEGCLSLSNNHFTELDNIVDFAATPVLIGTHFEWLDAQRWQQKKQAFAAVVDNWRAAWESRNSDTYLGYYSTSFNNGKMGYNRFSEHKRRVNESKTFIEVDIENLSIYQHPDNAELFVATFTQNYKSDNYSGSSLKRQYWVNEEGQWRIAYEGDPQKGKP